MSTTFPLLARGLTPQVSTMPKLAKFFATLLAVTVASLANSGCRTDDHMALMLDNPEERHAITFDRARETLVIEAPDHGMPLSKDQVLGLRRFLRNYKRQASSPLVVSSPRKAGARHAVKPILAGVHEIMLDVDVSTARVVAKHHSNRRGWPTVSLTYQRPVTVAPVCGDWSEDVAVNRERIHYPNYGCASQRNLAATVDNPRDLLRPRDATPRSSEKRSSAWKKYVGGSGKAKSEDTTNKTKPLSKN